MHVQLSDAIIILKQLCTGNSLTRLSRKVSKLLMFDKKSTAKRFCLLQKCTLFISVLYTVLQLPHALLGNSGRVVNSLYFCPASLKSLCCFYFLCVLSSQWKVVTVKHNFTLPTLKAFLEACSQNVSGNKQ